MTTRNATLLDRLRKSLASAGVLLVAALFVIPFALPATAPEAVASSEGVEELVLAEPVQSLEVSELSAAATVSREEFGATSYAQRLRKQYSGSSGVGGMCGPSVCWPFPYAVPMTDGYGPRVAPCAGCSTMHRGIDLLPGSGTPIYAIADGVVTSYQEGWSYGSHVFIEHRIDGQNITSLYAHMQAGSSPLSPGETVKRGDFVGLVGSTGAVTAPHLHLEVRLDGSAIDPLAWLRQKTGAG